MRGGLRASNWRLPGFGRTEGRMIGMWNEDRALEEIAQDDEDEEDEGEVNEEVSEYEKRERSFGGGQWASWGSALLLQQLCNEIQTFADKCSKIFTLTKTWEVWAFWSCSMISLERNLPWKCKRLKVHRESPSAAPQFIESAFYDEMQITSVMITIWCASSNTFSRSRTTPAAARQRPAWA